MHCSNCGSENPEGTNFCGNCGQPLSSRCSKCKADNPPGFKFCGACGQALSGSRSRRPRRADAAPDQVKRRRKSASSSTIADARIPENPEAGERKIVTALFADIKGSMELMQNLDPEEARTIVDP
ncbi:MAG: zinc ribbon domain-containing protein, partial [Deltaproteobacteria bacterium]|nr:zinc ribbon domain-containing protein [Deltaproteobacteria bacterium]